jgi:hypothetical protein
VSEKKTPASAIKPRGLKTGVVKLVGWKGVTDPALRERVEAVRTRSERRLRGEVVEGRSSRRGRWMVENGKVVREKV